jgi:hypothetical protein
MDGSNAPTTATRRRTIIAISGSLIVLYLLPMAGHPPAVNPNELVRLELALALGVWSTVDLDAPARVYGLSEDVARRDGRILADKAPGLSLAAVPVVWLAGAVLPEIEHTVLPRYWPLRHLATALLVATAATGLCWLLVGGIGDLGSADRLPLLVIAALATPLWCYGTVFFGHVPAAFLIAAAWVLLLRPFVDVDPANTRGAFVGGVAAGLAIATEYPTVLLIATISATLVARRTPGRRLALAFLGLTAGLLPALVYHQVAFGAPWLTGYAFKAEPAFEAIHSTGLGGVSAPTLASLWGVLFSPSRGLFFFSPVLLLAPLGLVLIHRRHGRRESTPLAVAATVYVVFAAGFVDWKAGWCNAARHLVPVVPLLLIPTLVALLALARRGWTLAIAAVLVSLSVIRGGLCLALTPFFPPEFSHPLRQLVMPSLGEGHFAPTLLGTGLGVDEGAIWVGMAVAAAVLTVWGLARLARSSGIAVAVVVAVVVIGQIGWLAWRNGPTDPEIEIIRSQLLAGLGHPETTEEVP